MPTPALVQSNKGGLLTTNASSVTVTLGGNTAAGNCLLAALAFRQAGSTFTGPANWSQLAIVSAGSLSVAIWAYPNNPGGLSSFVFNATGTATAFSATVSEWSGVAVAAILDKSTTNNNTVGTTAPDSGTTASTNQAVELWYAALAISPGSARTFSAPTNGFAINQTATATGSTGNHADVAELYKVVAATGTANTTATLNSSAPWAGVIVTLFGAGLTGAATLTGSDASTVAAQASGTATISGSGAGSVTAQASGTAALIGTSGGTVAAQASGAAVLIGSGVGSVAPSAMSGLVMLSGTSNDTVAGGLFTPGYAVISSNEAIALRITALETTAATIAAAETIAAMITAVEVAA